jgi:hypothetical protein
MAQSGKTDRCWLCGCSDVAHTELRPTGPDGRLQSWPHCSSCWESCQSNGRDVEPGAWRMFIMFILQIDTGQPSEQKSVKGV